MEEEEEGERVFTADLLLRYAAANRRRKQRG